MDHLLSREFISRRVDIRFLSEAKWLAELHLKNRQLPGLGGD